MRPSDRKFVEYWQTARKDWNWGKTFKNGVLYFALPIVILIDLVNFFIIGDVNYAFLSFNHFYHLLKNFLPTALFIGFAYGLYDWNSKEQKYWRILKKHKDEL